jgi:hypothetical protein
MVPEQPMDTPTHMSDLTALAMVLAASAAAIPVALAVASWLRLYRLAPRLKSPRLLSVIAGFTLGIMSLCVLLGLVPVRAVLSWWGAVPGAIAVLGTLVLVSTAAIAKPREKSGFAQGSDSEPGKLAA